MREIIFCPQCRRRLELPGDHVGQQVQCPACQKQFLADPSVAPPSIPVVIPVEAGIHPGAAVEKRDELRGEKSGHGRPPRAQRPRENRSSGMSPGKKKALVGVMVCLAGIILLVSILVLQNRAPPRPKPVVMGEDPEVRRKAILEAFRNQKPLDKEEIVQEVKPLFDELGQAFQARDADRITACFDTDRMLDEIEGQNVLPREWFRERGQILPQFQAGLTVSLEQQAHLLGWNDFEIRHIKKLEGNEAVLIVRHRHRDGVYLKMRWWVTLRPGSWKIYDFEDLDMGLRMSTAAGILGELGFNRLPEISGAVRELREALLAVAGQRDPDSAERKLQAIARVKLPGKLEALRHLVGGMMRLQRRQPRDALAELDRAQGFHGDMPILDLLRGIAYNDLRKWDQALNHLEKYRGLLGDDGSVCFELAEAYRGQGRNREAAASYRKALDYNPKHPDAFRGFLFSLRPGDKKDDVGARFLKLDLPHENFDIFADDCSKAHNGEVLEELARAMVRIDPGYVPPTYYLALVRIWAGKSDEGLALFKDALGREKDPGKRRDYLDGFFRAMAAAGKAVAAYQAAPDPGEAFRLLAEDLKKTFRFFDLKKLVKVHGQKHPDDRLLPFYQGEVYIHEGNYPQADKAFTAGMARPPDLLVPDQFRYNRVLARYHIGQALAAYKEIGPRGDTFLQLANLCYQDQNLTLLETLIHAHAKTDPQSPDIARFRIRLKIKRNQLAEAVALFKAGIARERVENVRKEMVFDFLFDMADAGKAVEGYQAAPDSRDALQTMAEDLLERFWLDELRKLLEAHRQRHPGDPWLAFYSGEIHIQEEAWDKAVAAFSLAWKKADKDLRLRVQANYVLALYKIGRGLEAYRDIDSSKESFQQLANLMAGDKKGRELLALLDVHRGRSPDDPALYFFEARARIFLDQPDAAIPLFQKAYHKQNLDYVRRNYADQFLKDMAGVGKVLEGYRAVPNSDWAFAALAGELVFKKKIGDLARLLEEHGKNHSNEPDFQFFAGELKKLQGDLKGAEREYLAALKKASPQDPYRFRQALFQVRVKAGQAVETYREFGPEFFENLGNICFAEKDGKQMEALIDLHGRESPDDPSLSAWKVEARWLKQDYAGALKLLEEMPGLLTQFRYRWKMEGYLVRCLIKTKRFSEAVKKAQTLVQTHRADSLLLVLAHAAAGDVKQAMAAMSRQSGHFFIDHCYRDSDLGPILRGQGFEGFRKQFPEKRDKR